MVKKVIAFFIKYYYLVKYVFTGKTRKDAFLKEVKKKGGMFVTYKNKYKTSKRYNKSTPIH